ncbi:uncharacterized protein LOC131683144 [Topomyia yanbarensis]|uniref:uncharacterized protein LOC131683144 n=1 Tax=Topomyia yanbarensis TaxID=2498891 RepID=UPI00273B93D6|nr:uncharacterized protein LOC131683144 [Topomyia yanbarensis]
MSLGVEYEKADSRNIPLINETMIARFFTTNASFASSEMKQIKVQRSGRKAYGDFAVGYVKLRRFGSKCDVRANVTSEHRINHRPYEVSLIIDEHNNIVEQFMCQCEANEGGCKHVSVFLFWLFRRNELPASTDVECYWKMAPMTEAARRKGVVWAAEMETAKARKNTHDSSSDSSVSHSPNQHRKLDPTIKANISIRFALSQATNEPFGMLKYLLPYDPHKLLSVDRLFICFKQSQPTSYSMEKFFEFCHAKMTTDLLDSISSKTVNQHTNADWYTYRIARITASVCYEASRCTTYDGSLKERIMGFNTPFESIQMKRGKVMEKRVLKVVQNQYGKIERSGLYLAADHPHLGATPDGIQSERVFEVKCPSSMKRVGDYISESGNVCAKWIAQMHLQMHLTGRKKSHFLCSSTIF